MSILNTPIQQPHGTPSAEEAYFKNGTLHPLPIEIWRYIGEFVATDPTPIKAAVNAIQLGKVNPFFHAFSHEPTIDGVIERGAKSKQKTVTHFEGFNPVTTTFDYLGRVISREKKGGARM